MMPTTSPNIQIFTEEPGSTFTGIVPGYLLPAIGKMDQITCICLKLLNKNTLKSESLNGIVESGRLVCLTYDKGDLKSICIDCDWVEKFLKEKVRGVVLSCGGDEGSIKYNVRMEKLETEYYNKMARYCVPLLNEPRKTEPQKLDSSKPRKLDNSRCLIL